MSSDAGTETCKPQQREGFEWLQRAWWRIHQSGPLQLYKFKSLTLATEHFLPFLSESWGSSSCQKVQNPLDGWEKPHCEHQDSHCFSFFWVGCTLHSDGPNWCIANWSTHLWKWRVHWMTHFSLVSFSKTVFNPKLHNACNEDMIHGMLCKLQCWQIPRLKMLSALHHHTPFWIATLMWIRQ